MMMLLKQLCFIFLSFSFFVHFFPQNSGIDFFWLSNETTRCFDDPLISMSVERGRTLASNNNNNSNNNDDNNNTINNNTIKNKNKNNNNNRNNDDNNNTINNKNNSDKKSPIERKESVQRSDT